MKQQASSGTSMAVFIQQQRALGFRVPRPELKLRWAERVVANDWHLQGRAGADAYLAKYGKSIGLPKLTGLALLAEQEHCQEFADQLWRKAHELAAGQPNQPAAPPIAAPAPPPVPRFNQFPSALRPGKVRLHKGLKVVRNARRQSLLQEIWGYELPEGEPLAVFVSGAALAYQTETKSEPRKRTSFQPALDEALLCLSRIVGPFVLEGTVGWRDGTGQVHLRESAAKQATPTTPPRLVFALLRALYVHQTSLTAGTEGDRIAAAEELTAYLSALAEEPIPFEVCQITVARTSEEKRALEDKGTLAAWVRHAGPL